MEFDGFDWDWGNREKCQKHGVSIRQIEELFRGVVFVGPDLWHSAAEERFRAIGRTTDQRSIFVAFTWRQRGNQRLIRPVSARYMHQKEVVAHEKKISASENR
ncbi:MAG: BrnT family toxin [Hyphomicrobiales bacterium]|nr:BrnT family toxin [Hyphomicrobiales bacterium]MBV9432652.1 BrnT family toxin [Hyphomicrobiales bacterium]MBV9739190.1 BrnT family toxin [Hyphomicrobiales bacterium]